MKILLPSDRLIVAADFKPKAPDGIEWVRKQVLTLADSLSGTGVYLKVNSALRACGYGLINEIRERNLRTFADLKLFDIEETLSTDGVLLREVYPELLTVVCSAGIASMKALKEAFPDIELLGVTVLTNLRDSDTEAMFLCSTQEAVMRFAQFAADAGIGGLISAATEVKMLREKFGNSLSYNTPAIRPSWAIIPGDDQNPDRIMTPAKAIAAGASRIIVGRPIVRADNPYDAAMRTIEEIDSAMSRMKQK